MTANILYPGYYPGDRPLNQNRRQKPTKPEKPQDWWELDAFFGGLQKDLNIPEKLYGLWWDEATSAFQVGIETSGASVTDILYQGEEAAEEFPGIAYKGGHQTYFGFSLNYLDLIKDPGKTLGKAAEQIVKSGADWNDVRGPALMELVSTMYKDSRNGDRHALDRDPANPYAIYDNGFRRRLRAQAVRTLAGQGLDNLIQQHVSNLNPYSLEGSGVKEVKKVKIGNTEFIQEKDPYKDVINNATNFVKLAAVPSKREGEFDKFLSSSYKATLLDLESTINASVNVPDNTPLEDKVRIFLTNKGLAPAQVNEGVELFTQFKLQNDFAGSAYGLNDYLTGRAGLIRQLDTVVKNRGAFGLDPRITTLSPTSTAGLVSSLNDYSDKLAAARTNLAATANGLRSFPPEKRKKYERVLKIYERDLASLERLQGSVDKFIANPNVLTALGIRNSITSITSAGIISGGIGGGSTLVHGAQRLTLREMKKDFEGKFGRMFMPFTSRVTGPGGAVSPITRGQTILGTLGWFEREYRWALASEFLDNLEGGRLFKVYVWPVIKAKISVGMPSYWISNALNRAHHFGLIINDELLDGSVFKLLLDWEDSSNPIKQGLRAVFVNKVKFGFDATDATILVRKTARMFGGNHLKFGQSLTGLAGGKSGVLTAGAMNEISKRLIELEKLAGIDWLNLTDAMKDQISAHLLDATFLTNLQAANNGIFVFGKASEATDFVTNYINFRAWLAKKPSRTGFDNLADLYASEGNVSSFLTGLLHYANVKDNLDISKQLVGFIEKFTSILNKTQSFLIKKLGFLLKPIMYYEQIFIRGGTKLITGLITKLGTLLASALSKLGIVIGSIGGPLGQLVTFLITLFARKIMKTVESFLKAVFKGDIDAFFKGLGKAADAAIKTSLYACLPFVGCGLFIGGIVTVILGAIPSSNAAVGGGYSEFGGGPVEAIFPCADDVVLDTSNTCFFQPGNFLSTPSYNNAGEVYNSATDFSGGDGHGSNDYYLGVTGVDERNGLCSFILPSINEGIFGAKAPTAIIGPNNVCYNKGKTPQSDVYGRAIDVAPVGDSCFSVFLPNINNEVDSWSVGDAYDFGTGNAALATGMVGGIPKYKLLLGHIASSYGGEGKLPGERAAELYDWGGNTHIHAELSVRNNAGGYDVVKPENFICNQ